MPENDVADNSGELKLPWHPAVAVLYTIVIFFISQILAGLIVSIYPALQHWSTARTDSWLNSSVAAQFAFVVLAEGLVVAGLWAFLRQYKRGFRAIDFGRLRLQDVGIGLAAFIPYFLIYSVAISVITHLVPSFNINQQQQLGFQSVHGAVALAMAFISLAVLPPIVEELLLRGFVYGSLREHISKIGAALITSVLFAAAHLPEGKGGALWVGFVDTFVLSLVLVYLREKTNNLWASITLHGLKNTIAFVVLFVIGAR